MQRLNRHLVSSLLAAPLVLAGLLLVGTGVAGPATGPSPGTLVRALRGASALSLNATVQYWSVDARNYPAVKTDGLPIVGRFTYVAQGNAWRAVSWLDPARFTGMDTDLSFDGEQEFVARTGSSVAAVSEAGEPTILGMTLPNPLFALASYARPVNDKNFATPLRLTDLRLLTDAALDIPADAWRPIVLHGVSFEQATLPGDVVGGIAYEQQILVEAGKRTEPVRIDRVTKDGTLLTRIEFKAWEAISGTTDLAALRLPRLVSMKEFRPTDGADLFEVLFIINDVKIGTPIAGLELVTNTSLAKHLWNADREEFIN